MFSDLVLEHFQNPRNAGELPRADAKVEVTNPVCGDVLQLAIRVTDGHISDVRFLCRGCATSIACASMLTEKLHGQERSSLRVITAQELSDSLGGLPAASFHAAQLAEDAVSALLAAL
jgi:nitrogen fixation NifU-like protein